MIEQELNNYKMDSGKIFKMEDYINHPNFISFRDIGYYFQITMKSGCKTVDNHTTYYDPLRPYYTTYLEKFKIGFLKSDSIICEHFYDEF